MNHFYCYTGKKLPFVAFNSDQQNKLVPFFLSYVVCLESCSGVLGDFVDPLLFFLRQVDLVLGVQQYDQYSQNPKHDSQAVIYHAFADVIFMVKLCQATKPSMQ